jgi:2,4-diaminopentanoate dehydrogenase
MAERPLRVAVISTGGVGALAIGAISRRSDYELIDVWVHSEEKVGKDAGELVGLGPLGVRTTGDLDEIVSLAPDCAVYSASAPELDAAVVADYEKLLRGGVNIVTTTTPGMIFPAGWFPEFAQRVHDAALAGGVTAYTSGIEPGFAADQLPVLLSTLTTTIRSIRTQEIFDYSADPVTYWMFDCVGFGMPMDYQPLLAFEGAQQYAGGPVVRLVAEALGITFDEITESYERFASPRDLQVASGLIKAGTCGAVRFETSGVIEGEPKMQCDLRLSEDQGAATANDAGMLATCMRAVNAIPYVVAAQPGIVTSLDLPITTPRHSVVPGPATSRIAGHEDN